MYCNRLKITFLLSAGHIRIRAKSQGMALSLGDKINTSQKSRSKKTAAQAQQQNGGDADEATAAAEN